MSNFEELLHLPAMSRSALLTLRSATDRSLVYHRRRFEGRGYVPAPGRLNIDEERVKQLTVVLALIDSTLATQADGPT